MNKSDLNNVKFIIKWIRAHTSYSRHNHYVVGYLKALRDMETVCENLVKGGGLTVSDVARKAVGKLADPVKSKDS